MCYIKETNEIVSGHINWDIKHSCWQGVYYSKPMRLSFSPACTKTSDVTNLLYQNRFPNFNLREWLWFWNLLSNHKTSELFLQTASLLPRALPTNGRGDGEAFITFFLGQRVSLFTLYLLHKEGLTQELYKEQEM